MKVLQNSVYQGKKNAFNSFARSLYKTLNIYINTNASANAKHTLLDCLVSQGHQQLFCL